MMKKKAVEPSVKVMFMTGTPTQRAPVAASLPLAQTSTPREASTVLGNDSTFPTAQYTVEPADNSVKNMGKDGPGRERTAQNTHSERLKRRKRTLPKYLIPDEKDALFGVIDDRRDRAIFRLAYHHGLRASEIGMIQVKDWRRGTSLDMDRLFLRRLKGSIGGETILVNAAANALRGWLRIRGTSSGAIFTSRNHRPISRRRLDELMKHYCKLAGIPEEKAHFHALKHTCGTLLLSVQRESIVDVQKHLGHADIRNTMIYAQLTDEANRERAERLRDWR
jgi:integrase